MMGRPIPIRQEVNNITDCVDDYDDDVVVKSILEMNTSSKSVVGFRSYNDTNDDIDKSSIITANDEGQVTTTPAATATPERVLNHYRNMRTYQTVEFHTRMMEKYTFTNGIYRYVIAVGRLQVI